MFVPYRQQKEPPSATHIHPTKNLYKQLNSAVPLLSFHPWGHPSMQASIHILPLYEVPWHLPPPCTFPSSSCSVSPSSFWLLQSVCPASPSQCCFGCPLYPHPRLCAAAAAKSLQSCQTLCNPIDGSPPGSPVPGILQARTLEWVAISFSNAAAAKSLQLCPTLCDPIDSSPPGSAIPGILQARTLERVAISFSSARETKNRSFHFLTKGS